MIATPTTAAVRTHRVALRTQRGVPHNVTRYDIGLYRNFVAKNDNIKSEYGVRSMNSVLVSGAYTASLSEEHMRSITEIGTYLNNPTVRSWYFYDGLFGSFTMNDVLCDMTIRSRDGTVNHLDEPYAIELGKFINHFLPDRRFEKVDIMVGSKKMNVKLYYQYERDEIEHLVKIFFNRLDLIKPHHMMTQSFNVITFLHGFITSLSDDTPQKEVLSNMFITEDAEKMNIMTFQNELMDHLPITIRILADESGAYDMSHSGFSLYHIPAHYVFFAEHFALSVASRYLTSE
jgi:hypothetical protein